MSIGRILVEADYLDLLTLSPVFGGDGVESGDTGGIPDVRFGHVDHHPVRITDVVELVDKVVARGEEQFAAHQIVRRALGAWIGGITC